MNIRARRRQGFTYFLYVLPALAIYLTFRFVPFMSNYLIAFFKWSGYGLSTMQYTGLANYARLFTDPVVKEAVINTILFLLNEMILVVGFALLVSLLLNTGIRGSRIFRTTFFTPVILPLVVIGTSFVLFLNPRWGIVNFLLRAVGLDSMTRFWLSDEALVRPVVFAIRGWRAFGYYMVLLLAGLEGISRVLYDAAKVDGANWWQILRHVTLPSLKRIMTMVSVLAMINGLKVFVIPLVMTGGGPFHKTEILATWSYYVGFKVLRMGYASTISAVLASISIIFAFIYLRVSKF